ncbi:MAG: DUF1552 domain-containing protein [Deltaproteobacteria bacterium]|nr:DUF1552 domain-containing protein [Deltaproteobacteria bacterium]
MLIRTDRPAWGLSRRTLLRSGLTTLIGLPVLEAMAPSIARAQANGQDPLRRFMAFYLPNGMHMPSFTPSTEGALGTLPLILQPLESVKQHVTIVSGLENRAAFSGEDGPGDHARGTGTFLTVQRLLKSDVDIRNGLSVDQAMATHVRSRGFTGLSSLELGCEGGGSTGNCDSGYSCAYSVNVAWAGATSPLPKETNPRAVFDRLFAGQDPAASTAEREKQRRYKRSILDVVKGDAARLEAKLGSNDKQKLAEHLTGIRELELQLESGPVAACTPGERPAGVSGDVTAYVRSMLDLVVASFTCDRTRVATFMVGNGGSGRNFSFIGVNGAHHEISHHQSDPAKLRQLEQIDRWEMEQLAYVIGKLALVDDGNGTTALDNTMIYCACEIEDGNTHNHRNLPVVVAGRAGGRINSGRHVRAPGRSVADLFLTGMQSMGMTSSSFADSSGPLVLT